MNDPISFFETSEWLEKQYSVEEGYDISAEFFCELWPSFKPKVSSYFREGKVSAYELFVETICNIRIDGYTEWNDAIFHALHIPKRDQRLLALSQKDIFLATLEFCRIHNERFFNGLIVLLKLLESMLENPRDHIQEWDIWIKNTQRVMSFEVHPFDWEE
jgi:hypothetical protein